MSELVKNLPTTETGVEFIGNDSLLFKCIIFDSDDNQLVLRKGGIEELVIEDNISNWYHSGYIDIKNPHDTLERSNIARTNSGDATHSGFSFRNDGNLLIYISVEPNLSNDSFNPMGMNSEVFSMEFIFSVYNQVDIDDDIENKVKRLYFTDYRHQHMATHMSFYSTSNTFKSQPTETQSNVIGEFGVDVFGNEITSVSPAPDVNLRTSHMQDDDAEVFTGDAIKSLLSTSLASRSSVNFATVFDQGAYKTFYTSPVGYTALDDLNYLLSSHVSTDGTKNVPCLLRTNRFVKDAEFFLVPVTTIYDLAYDKTTRGPSTLTSELFLLGSPATSLGGDKVSIKKPRVPEGNTPVHNYHFPDKSILNNYTFNDVQNSDNDKFLNSKVAHLYSHKRGEFSSLMSQGYIKNARDFFKENIVDNLIIDDTTGGEPSWNINKNKILNKNMTHYFTTSDDAAKTNFKARNQTLMYNILNGRQISFTCPGVTSRQTMKFIGIDRQDASNDNNLDNKLLGQFLTTNVRHIFNEDGYTNEITATKQYNFTTIHNNDE